MGTGSWGLVTGDSMATSNEPETHCGRSRSGLLLFACCRPKSEVRELVTGYWYLGTGDRRLNSSLGTSSDRQYVQGSKPRWEKTR